MNFRSTRWILATLFVLLLAAGQLPRYGTAGVLVKDVTISANDQTTTIDCSASSVVVHGEDNNLTLRGECKKLKVTGNDNRINAITVNEVEVSGDDNVINVETVTTITTTGDDNNISWKSGAGGEPPKISTKGDDNHIRQRGN